jgi:hypothetical protein
MFSQYLCDVYRYVMLTFIKIFFKCSSNPEDDTVVLKNFDV